MLEYNISKILCLYRICQFFFFISVYATVISDYGVSKYSLSGLNSLCSCGKSCHNELFFKGVATTVNTANKTACCHFITNKSDLPQLAATVKSII